MNRINVFITLMTENEVIKVVFVVTSVWNNVVRDYLSEIS